MDCHSAKLFSCDLVKVAKLGPPQLVAIHVCSDSDHDLKENPSTKGCLEHGTCICNVKQVHRTGTISRGSLIRKLLKRVAKHCAAMVVLVGTNPENGPVGWISFARYCAAKLPTTTAVLAVHEGKLIFQTRSIYELAGFKLLRPNLHLKENHTSLSGTEASVIEKTSSCAIQTSEDVSRDGSEGLEVGNLNTLNEYREEDPFSSISLLLKEMPESTPGWPLRRRAAPVSQEAFRKSEGREMSVVQWVMSLPNRSTPVILQTQIDLGSNKTDNSFEKESENSIIKEQKIERTSPQAIQILENETVHGGGNSKDENLGLFLEYKADASLNSVSSLIKELPHSVPGWPLLRKEASATPEAQRKSEAREMSVVQWVMSLPNRSLPVTLQTQIGFGPNEITSPVQREIGDSGGKSNKNWLTESRKLPKELELLFKTNLSGCRWFSYEELKAATSQFSSENLIGEGGCSIVYKGYLPSGKPVAVKILNLYREAWNDFSLEVDIASSLKHKNITPLIGVCVEDNYLISVYEFFHRGSLEENIHGNKESSVLPWDVRFKVAVLVAEALNYLHNECSRPVIHRDVKSSNIVLSNDFQPQLSDFGLAIWGTTDSSYVIDSDVVGTFGYIAPEYFMLGRVSDKIDVYSFGVVLLELLSGRRPIGSTTLKGQESLVKWAKPILKSGDLKALLDPKLDGEFDTVQIHRVVLAATVCINQSARLRPNMSQILKLLRGESDGEELVKSDVKTQSGNQEDDELYPEFCFEPHLGFSLLDADDDETSSLSREEQNNHFSFRDYLKGWPSLCLD